MTEVFIDRDIFRCYDVRGRVDTQINQNVAYCIGRAFAQLLIGKNINTASVGCDSRLSSPTLKQALIRGLLQASVNVTDIGVCTTPLLSFVCNNSSGIMVTASHNPTDYNGFKFIVNGEIFTQLDLLIDVVNDCSKQSISSIDKLPIENLANLTDACYKKAYIQAIVDNIQLKQKHRIIVDGANSPAGLLAIAVFQQLGCHVGGINLELDGAFPSHSPDTGVEKNYRQLQKEVIARNADFGFMFDGDGDRCVAVSGKGNIIWPDQMLTLMSEDLLRQEPLSTIIYDIKCSNQVINGIKKNHGFALLSKTGRSNIFQMLKDNNAQLAGEFSGHFFYQHRWIGTDDGIYAACRLVEGCELLEQSLQQRIDELEPSYCSPEIKVEIADTDKFKLVQYLIDEVQQQVSLDVDIVTIDGLRINYVDGWALIRSSNTMPALTLRFEANSEARLQDMVQFVIQQLYAVAQRHHIELQPETLFLTELNF